MTFLPYEFVSFEGRGKRLALLVPAHNFTHATETNVADAIAGGEADEVFNGLADLNRHTRMCEEDATGTDILGLAELREAPSAGSNQLDREFQLKPF